MVKDIGELMEEQVLKYYLDKKMTKDSEYELLYNENSALNWSYYINLRKIDKNAKNIKRILRKYLENSFYCQTSAILRTTWNSKQNSI